MTILAAVLSIALVSVSTVDEAIELYLMGDMSGSITALEDLLEGGNLSLDEQLRAYHRLGAAYYGLGETESSRDAFLQVLMLDPYYELGLWENPNLMRLLDQVRQESMSTILVQGFPDGSLVLMNGDYVGTAPYSQDNLIGGNSYTITILAEGYEPEVLELQTQPGQLHTLTYKMRPLMVDTLVAAVTDTAPDIQIPATDTIPDIEMAMADTMPDIEIAMADTMPDIEIAMADTVPDIEIAMADTVPDIEIAMADTVPDIEIAMGDTLPGPTDANPIDTEGSGVISGSGTSDSSPLDPDLSPLPISTDSIGTMTPDELMTLLSGGAEMTSLGGIGPLSSGSSQMEEGTSQINRDPSIFQTTSGQIETVTGDQNRMVFSEVASDTQDVQTPVNSSYSSRTSEEIMDVLEDKTSAVTFIYNKHLRGDPLLSGTVLIELDIEPSGRVSDVNIIHSTTYNPAFDLELATAVETWRFGAVDEDEGPLTVQYPFSFSR